MGARFNKLHQMFVRYRFEQLPDGMLIVRFLAKMPNQMSTVLSCIVSIICIIGVIFNLIVFRILFTVRISSEVTSGLLRFECFICACSCLFALLSTHIRISIPSGLKLVDLVACYCWENFAAIWFWITWSISGMVCLNLERVIAIYFPLIYRAHPRRLLLLAVIYWVLMWPLAYASIPIHRTYSNGTCVITYTFVEAWRKLAFKTYIFLWCVLMYVIPGLVLVVTQTLVIWRIRKKSLSYANQKTIQPTGELQVALDEHVRRLIWTTVAMSSFFLLLHLPDTLLKLLNAVRAVHLEPGSITEMIGIVSILSCDAFYPILLICMTSTLKAYVKCKLICGVAHIARYCHIRCQRRVQFGVSV
ncbi:hypothetical protein CSKR_106857 [Clonorchis sinensis]|uniref:Amine GPCR n=2 Tax=Clonorchis sinensis TaxID=79923 RepID=G7YHM2_CLOSI|nr:hypothetical protein CSKR_106857 [Clonorchis sinensis]GAA52455.1 amine GPCR [Clonorchis sinensis]